MIVNVSTVSFLKCPSFDDANFWHQDKILVRGCFLEEVEGDHLAGHAMGRYYSASYLDVLGK